MGAMMYIGDQSGCLHTRPGPASLFKHDVLVDGRERSCLSTAAFVALQQRGRTRVQYMFCEIGNSIEPVKSNQTRFRQALLCF